ncbi:MAG: M1 family metallopeptidase [Gemmatimonadota bacterium]
MRFAPLRFAFALAVPFAVACASAERNPAPDLTAPSAPERPRLTPVDPSPAFQDAIQNGTRMRTGRPGPAYWRQRADYSLRARLVPDDRQLLGTARIVYHNESPDTLRELNLALLQNHHAAGAMRSSPAEVTGGIELGGVAVDGRNLEPITGEEEDDRPGYEVFGTRMRIVPPAPVPPGGAAEIVIDYRFRIPQVGIGGRMGYSGEDLFYIAYWYPQMAVYDDVVGWQVDQFLGNAEFYADFGIYDVTIEAPSGWLVRATGELMNPDETLAAPIRERLQAAVTSDTIVHVVTEMDFDQQTVDGGTLSWRFRADSVHDFAFSATRASLLDATRAPVGDRNGDGTTDYTRIEALYRPAAPLWRETARYAAHAIDFLSRYTALAYPWPHMTAVEGGGIIGGGMEFPMMTLIGDYNERGADALYYVVAHELAHMWIPMIVANDERRYAWMDEGSTTFHENRAREEFFPDQDSGEADREDYVETAQAGLEGEIMRLSDYHYPGPAYGVASYDKPAQVLRSLRGLLGEETFLTAWRAFIERWAWKHPYPWDLFNTFEDISGRDLDWFWRSWYYEIWLLDQALTEVSTTGDTIEIVVEDQGRVPMPTPLIVTRVDGSVERHEIPVDTWLSGRLRAVVTVPAEPAVTRVEIDPEELYPDVDRSDNVWTASPSSP